VGRLARNRERRWLGIIITTTITGGTIIITTITGGTIITTTTIGTITITTITGGIIGDRLGSGRIRTAASNRLILSKPVRRGGPPLIVEIEWRPGRYRLGRFFSTLLFCGA
jgi:hypothetical protein